MQQSAVDDAEVAATIVSKLGDTPGISYTDIATKAKDCGRTELAIRVSHCHIAFGKSSMPRVAFNTPGYSLNLLSI